MKPLVLALVLMMVSSCLAANYRKDLEFEMHEHENKHVKEDESVEGKHPEDSAESDHHSWPRDKFDQKYGGGGTGGTGNR